MRCICGNYTPMTTALTAILGTEMRQEDILKTLSMQSCGQSLQSALLMCFEHKLISKMRVVSEYRKIANIEQNLYRATLKEYIRVGQRAINLGVKNIKSSGRMSKENIYDGLKLSDNHFYTNFPSKSLIKLWKKSVKDVYVLAKTAIRKKYLGVKGYKKLVYKADPVVSVKPSLSVVDERAILWLEESQVFWLSDPAVWTGADDIIRSVASDSLLGLPIEEAGIRIQSAIEMRYGLGVGLAKSGAYWEGLVANAATTARVSSSIYGMSELGIRRYEIVNPMDRRTSQICQYMNGKVMEISNAVDLLDRMVSMADPTDIKAIHPWPAGNFKQQLEGMGVKTPSSGQFPAGDRAMLAARGFAFPPFHFRCRSTVDMTDDFDF